jgi:hypothetical protein
MRRKSRRDSGIIAIIGTDRRGESGFPLLAEMPMNGT